MNLSIARNQIGHGMVIPPDWRSVLAQLSTSVQEAWEERAAIIQYDGGEPRPTAERRAFQCVVDAFEEAEGILQAHLAISARPSTGSSLSRLA